jgi:hypothetical protein
MNLTMTGFIRKHPKYIRPWKSDLQMYSFSPEDKKSYGILRLIPLTLSLPISFTESFLKI